MAVSVTVIKLLAPDTGVLCRMVFVLNVGTTTVSGSAPLVTPYTAVPGFAIAALAIDPMLLLPSVSAACTLTAGDVRSDVGFVKLNVIVQGVFAGTVAAAVKISVPIGNHVPDVPSALFSHVVTARLDDVAVPDPASPEIATVASDDPPVVRS